jgi:pilus assembly protein CpaE
VRRYPTAQQLDELIASRKPTSVIVGLSGPDAALELIAHLQAQHSQVFVATAHTTDLSDLILAGIRAGAKEYVGPPFSGTALERVLRPQKPRESVGRRGGRLICFMPARGGCGGSTVAVHMATALARESKERVLFVDFDFHAGTVDLCLGLRTEFTLADAVRRRSDLDELWAQLTHRWNDCSVLAAPPSGHSIEAEILRETPSVFESARRAYDWVVCDLPAAVYTSSVRVLEQAEVVYLVSTPELNSLKLARRKARELFDLGIPEEAIRLIANRVGEASPLSDSSRTRSGSRGACEPQKLVLKAEGGSLRPFTIRKRTGVSSRKPCQHTVPRIASFCRGLFPTQPSPAWRRRYAQHRLIGQKDDPEKLKRGGFLVGNLDAEQVTLRSVDLA